MPDPVFLGNPTIAQTRMAVRGKAVFVGDSGVGKTSIIACFLTPGIADVTPTLGAMATPVGVALNVWGTAGQEESQTLSAVVAVVVFDLSSAASLAHLPHWLACIGEHGPDLCQLLIVGNRADAARGVRRGDRGRACAARPPVLRNLRADGRGHRGSWASS
jgi:GTPase SAR1 family protein